MFFHLWIQILCEDGCLNRYNKLFSFFYLADLTPTLPSITQVQGYSGTCEIQYEKGVCNGSSAKLKNISAIASKVSLTSRDVNLLFISLCALLP